MHDALFRPVRLGELALPNRVLMAPMTRSRATDPETAAGALQARYYAQRASAGLIVTEGTQISAEGVGYVATPGIYTEAHVAGWREVTQAVHAAGGRILAQLWHVGRISHADFHGGAAPVAPSALVAEGQTFTPEGPKPFSAPRALTTDEVVRVVGDFEHAARQAKAAGFDGVQIHGANGYLVDQFLRDGANQRTDRYGGSAENRSRFLAEVTEAVVGVWGEGRVSVRLSPHNVDFNSQHDSDPMATFAVAARRLAGFPLAYLEGVVFGGVDDPAPHTMLKEAWGGAYVANGGFRGDSGARFVEEGRADAISYGATFLANPDLPWRFLHGAALNEPDRDTFYQGGEQGYLTYPRLDDDTSA